MVNALVAGLATFTLVFVLLRGAEWGYHKLRHHKDYSPHWGSWVFAVLLGLYAAISNLGRM